MTIALSSAEIDTVVNLAEVVVFTAEDKLLATNALTTELELVTSKFS